MSACAPPAHSHDTYARTSTRLVAAALQPFSIPQPQCPAGSPQVLALPVCNGPAFALDCKLPKSPGLMFGLVWAHQELAPGGSLAHLRGPGVGADGDLRTGELAMRGLGMEADALTLKSVLPS